MRQTIATKPLLASLLLYLATSVAWSAESIHFLVPGGAGSGWDTTARAVGRVLRATGLVDVASFENRSGAGGGKAIAVLIETSRQRSNTLMVSSTPIIVRSLTRAFPYSYRDLTPIARVIGDYQALAVRPDSAIAGFPDIVALYRKDPRSVRIAGGSVRGDLDHLVPALAFKAAGLNPGKLVYVPYDGGGRALAGFLTGEADLLSTGVSEALAYHRSDKLRIVAVSAGRRIDALDDVATIREQGVPFEFINWRGFFAAPGIAPERADAYAAVLRRMQETPEWEVIRRRNGWQNLYLDRVDFNAFLANQERELRTLLIELGFLRPGST